ncbi:MAG: hypothetical protein IKF01_04340 [Bacilli bacterium]|nr:hypothetical protein [Bacilli bacterium]
MKIRSKKLLFLYRSILFKRVVFETDYPELNEIVCALNIKNRYKRYNYVYDETVKWINKYYKNDLCMFKDNQCIVQRKTGKINGCCMYCPIVTENGCPSQNIACKLIYCKTALKNLKPLKLGEIPVVKCIPFTRRLILRSDFFQTKEKVLDDLKLPIFIYCLKTIFRNLKMR